MDISFKVISEIYRSFQSLDNKYFTSREVEVIACILTGKSEKKIADILGVSQRGISAHTRNIRQKIGATSKDGIIEFVEKFSSINNLKVLYRELLYQSEFRKTLKKINFKIKNKKIKCSIFLEKKTPFSERLGKNLQEAGIKITEGKDLEALDSLVIFLDATEQFFAFSKKHSKSTKNSILVLSSLEKSAGVKSAICFQEEDDYYLLFMKLLKKILPPAILEESFVFFQNIQNEHNKTSPYFGRFSQKKKGAFINVLTLNWKILFSFFASFIILFFSITFLFFPAFFAKIEDSLLPKKYQVFYSHTWNEPELPLNYVRREKYINTIYEKMKRYPGARIGIFGLGGMGKTFLAMDFFHSCKNSYKFKAWFNAESRSLIKSSYIKVGEKYGLFPSNISTELKIDIVKNWIEDKGNSLLVYDNVSDTAVLNGLIPRGSSVIITSRNHKLPNAIEINVMGKREAVELVLNTLSKNNNTYMANLKHVEKFVKMLNYIPLAISQGVAYINENVISIPKYIDLYTTERKTLLSKKVTTLANRHEAPYVTWDINLESIKKDKLGKEAVKLLEFISFLYPKDIPKVLLMQIMFGRVGNKAEVSFNEIAMLLRKYSLISMRENTINIHYLVSLWINDKIKKDRHALYLRKIKKSIQELYPKKIDDIESNFFSVSPGEKAIISSLVFHIDKLLLKVDLFSTDKEKMELYAMGADAYHAIGDIEKSKKNLEVLIDLKKKHYGNRHKETKKTLKNLQLISRG